MPTPSPPKPHKRKRILATHACSDPNVPKLDVSFRIATPNATTAAMVLSAFQEVTSGEQRLVRGNDTFDASVICGVSYAPAIATAPSPLLSTTTIASLEEIRPEVVAAVPAPGMAISNGGNDKAAPIDSGRESATKSAEDVPAASESSKNGSNDGNIAGAVVGAMVAAVVAVGSVYVYRRRVQKQANTGGISGTGD